MTITTTKETPVTQEIKTPAYFKNGNNYIALIDENNILSCYCGDKWANVSSGTVGMMQSDIRRAVDGKEIGEDEFFDAYQKALMGITLTPSVRFDEEHECTMSLAVPKSDDDY